jgi:hypothetical protein
MAPARHKGLVLRPFDYTALMGLGGRLGKAVLKRIEASPADVQNGLGDNLSRCTYDTM